MPAAPEAAFVKARTYPNGVRCSKRPTNRKSIITAFRSNAPPLTKSLITKKPNPNKAISQHSRALCSIFSAGVPAAT